jgi:hypothetical protein
LWPHLIGEHVEHRDSIVDAATQPMVKIRSAVVYPTAVCRVGPMADVAPSKGVLHSMAAVRIH